MIKFPWSRNEEGEKIIQDWMVEYLMNHNIPKQYLKQPSEHTENQVQRLLEYLMGPRNFILLLSQNSAYVWELYYYLVSAWVTSTNKGFYILDIKEFDTTYANEIVPKIEAASLLVIPSCDPQAFDLRKKRGILGNILSHRKARHKPFITDFFFKKLPQDSKIPQEIQPISNIFGESSVPLFLSPNSNSKIVKIKEE